MSNNNSNQEIPEDVWEEINAAVADCKQYTIKRYPDENISKYEYIGFTVGNFIE